MVSIFSILGLPNPKTLLKRENSKSKLSTRPGPKAGNNKFHDLGENRWSDRTKIISQKPVRSVIYITPDKLHRLPFEGVEHQLALGDMAIFDINSLNHISHQQSICARKIRELGDRTGLPVFSINENETLLMIPGAKMRVDTKKHRLGVSR
ncbi:MAG: hypothetical protein CL993_03435 [Euryarchaeota archaeon]|nr:hypothetical protein [Euryarchaeota archaeon]|tara:strand:+ start:264 stop:716 length:453 start_codon:yes stop_codon:yes gene_type:complete